MIFALMVLTPSAGSSERARRPAVLLIDLREGASAAALATSLHPVLLDLIKAGCADSQVLNQSAELSLNP